MRYSCGLELGKRRLEFPAMEKKLIRSGLPELWLKRQCVSVIWKKQGTGVERSWVHLCVGHTSAIISRSDFIKQIYSSTTLILWTQHIPEKILPDLNTPQMIWCSFCSGSFEFKYIASFQEQPHLEWYLTWVAAVRLRARPRRMVLIHDSASDFTRSQSASRIPVSLLKCYRCCNIRSFALWHEPWWEGLPCFITGYCTRRNIQFHAVAMLLNSPWVVDSKSRRFCRGEILAPWKKEEVCFHLALMFSCASDVYWLQKNIGGNAESKQTNHVLNGNSLFVCCSC